MSELSSNVLEVLRVPCDLQAVAAVRQFVRRSALEGGVEAQAAEDLVLAASEAASNAITYGCPAGSDVEVRWIQDPGRTMVEVRDGGIFRKRIPPSDAEDSHGRGIPLMIALVDEMHLREGTARRPGTVVRLVKDRTVANGPGPSPPPRRRR